MSISDTRTHLDEDLELTFLPAEIAPVQFAKRAGHLVRQGKEGVSELVDLLIHTAVDLDASDLHLEPTAEGLSMRLRLDGVLQNFGWLPIMLTSYLATRFKVLAGVPTYRSNVPQEGHITSAASGLPVDLRVSTYPTLFGERTAVRVLDPRTRLKNIQELGFSEEVHKGLSEALHLHDGLVLIAGPAGSGKTTTLYAALEYILQESQQGRCIVTIEDPIEIVVPGIMQTQVNRAVGLDFSSSLRSLLRHDVEVIMVGEIRDAETANIAVEAALTGHLVLATVHASRVATVPYRLLEMGVPPYALAGGLKLVLAQRLARQLDPDCTRAATKDEKVGMPEEARKGARVPDAAKCAEKKSTGYRGRFLLCENLPISQPLRRAIMEKASLTRFIKVTEKEGANLDAQAVAAVREGRTSWEEACRVLADELRRGDYPMPTLGESVTE